MKLTNPTDYELNAAFAETVAGWTWRHEVGAFAFPTRQMLCPPDWRGVFMWGEQTWKDGRGSSSPAGLITEEYNPMPPYTTSADAVLPWLIKHSMWDAEQFLPLALCRKGCAFQVRLKNVPDKIIVGDGDTFPRAAVIALLRANRVDVELTA